MGLALGNKSDAVGRLRSFVTNNLEVFSGIRDELLYTRGPTQHSRRCKSHEEYQLGLIAVNHFYNFGRQLSPEGSNKLFALSMRCGELEESIKVRRQPPNTCYVVDIFIWYT